VADGGILAARELAKAGVGGGGIGGRGQVILSINVAKTCGKQIWQVKMLGGSAAL
jgi:hypothetical protein